MVVTEQIISMWDSDGVLLYDHSLKDMPHFELI